ncbi:uncharacterized protein LOC123689956 [Pieris rapae]|uniref:uncharacterized protein LOC123689956 n=1 Tax=Pieris rapae TaxID=64459 RepID=UPI001E27B4AF|nr:uncharacterized protein LOC123689956 [Pieris rapae]
MLRLVFTSLFVLTNGYRTFDVDGEETILAFENEKIHIGCKSDYPMTYCGFVDPYGKRYSFTDLAVHDGQCVHVIKAKKIDSGDWRCHIGSKSVRLETIKKIRVRVVSKLAAVQPNITARLGKAMTLTCATTGGFIPLSYCRFEPPNGRSFSIDETVTDSNPILNRYLYPNNRSLDRGDCCVTIRKVKPEDQGLWICGAGLDDGKEHFDTITFDIEGINAMSTASTTAVTIGGILVTVALGFIIYGLWKRKGLLGVQENQPEDIEMRTPQARRQVPELVVVSPSTATPAESPLMSSTRSE